MVSIGDAADPKQVPLLCDHQTIPGVVLIFGITFHRRRSKQEGMSSTKVAIIHDWLTGMRGGERVLETLCEIFPQAHLYTLLHHPGTVSSIIEKMPIHTSFIQDLPFSKRGYRRYLPLFPTAIERFDLKGFDLILSCSHCVAKGIIPPPDALHISYLLTPMRYAWDMYGEYFGAKKSKIIPLLMHYLRMWDVTSSQRVDHFLCISHHVAKRIKKFYRRSADVIYPPVETHRFKLQDKKEDFFLAVSALVPYKRIDLAVEAFNRLGYPLRIVGSGPEDRRLRAMARSNVVFMGCQPDEVVAETYSTCRALIFPGEEDFGIVPLEAMASGRPVIAYGRGGALETVLPHEQQSKGGEGSPTGLFFYDHNADSLIDALERFITIERQFDPGAIRGHALRWDQEIFKENIEKTILKKMGSQC